MEWLRPGETCWKAAAARRAWLLVDGEQYFTALRKAAIAAKRSIFIVGWDVDTRVNLSPVEDDGDGYPETLLDFLKALLERNQSLNVYVLAWDFSMIYALERETLPSYRFAKDGHPRLHYVLDSQHPVGASHHQKTVVIDDELAFVGGYDLTIRRWDTAQHRADDPARVDPDGEPYAPIHDVQMGLQGEAAALVLELVRRRWQVATNEELAPVSMQPHEPLKLEGAVVFEGVRIGIARTLPSLENGGEDVREVLNATLDGIRRAQRLIYIENQYLTAAAVADALVARLDEGDCPHVILVLPQLQSGWLEKSSMGVLRARMLSRLHRHDKHGRLHVYAPMVSGDVPVQVHSKLIVIDDDMLKVGSANLSNRSMGLDTECDVAIAVDADSGPDDHVRQGIRRTRAFLIAEHLGLPMEEVLAATEPSELVALIESRRGQMRCLQPIPDEPDDGIGLAGLEESVADPERPIAADDFLRGILPVEMKHPGKRSLLALLTVIVALGASGALLTLTPWSDAHCFERVKEVVLGLQKSALSPLYVSLLFVAATLVFCPITLLIGATVLVFDPFRGFAHAMLGALLAASASYWLGRALGRPLWRTWGTPRLYAFRRKLREHGLRATMIARVLPVGNFTLINFMAGSVPVRFPAFLAGNVLGLLPGVLSLTLLAHQLEHTLRSPNASNVSMLILFVCAFGLLMYGASKLLGKWEGRRGKVKLPRESVA